MLKYIGVVALAAGFAACEHPDISEVFDKGAQSYEGNIAYMRAPSTTDYTLQYRASNEEGGYTVITSFNEELPLSNVQLTHASEAPVTVTLEYDTEALDALNAQLIEEQGEDAKQYQLFSKSGLNATTFTFTDGETLLPLSMQLDTEELFGTESNKYFAVPVRIASVSESGSAISSNMGNFMLKFDVEYLENAFNFSSGSQRYELRIFEEGGAYNGMEEWALSSYLRSNYPMAENTTVKLRINNSLIASSAYPEDKTISNVKLSKDTFTFEAGTAANEQISLIFADGMNSLKADENYQIPIEIETVTGHGTAKGATAVLTCRIESSVYTPKYVTFVNPEEVFDVQFDSDTKALLNGASTAIFATTVQTALSVDKTTTVYVKRGDASLVDKYNQEHQTNYELAPNATISSTYYFYLWSGSKLADGYSVRVQFSDSMRGLSADKTYIVPVVFDRVNTQDTEVQLTDNVFYAIFKPKMVTVPMSVSTTGSLQGTMVPRESVKAWQINMSNPDTKVTDKSDDVNGISSSTLVSINATTNALLIDLGDVRLLSGFEFYAYMSTYSIKQLGFQTSTDGAEWDVWDDTFVSAQGSVQYFTIKEPKNVRYIRFVPKAAFSGTYVYMSARAGGIKFYEIK